MIDKEVVDFTQKGGWHKIDKSLPVVYRGNDRTWIDQEWIVSLEEVHGAVEVCGLLFRICWKLNIILLLV